MYCNPSLTEMCTLSKPIQLPMSNQRLPKLQVGHNKSLKNKDKFID